MSSSFGGNKRTPGAPCSLNIKAINGQTLSRTRDFQSKGPKVASPQDMAAVFGSNSQAQAIENTKNNGYAAPAAPDTGVPQIVFGQSYVVDAATATNTVIHDFGFLNGPQPYQYSLVQVVGIPANADIFGTTLTYLGDASNNRLILFRTIPTAADIAQVLGFFQVLSCIGVYSSGSFDQFTGPTVSDPVGVTSLYAVVVLSTSNEPTSIMTIGGTPTATIGVAVSGSLPAYQGSGIPPFPPYAMYRVSTVAGANLGRSTLTGCDAYFCTVFPDYTTLYNIFASGTFPSNIYRMQSNVFEYSPISTGFMYILVVLRSPSPNATPYVLTPRLLPQVTVNRAAATLTITTDFFLNAAGTGTNMPTEFVVPSGLTLYTPGYEFNLASAKPDVIAWFTGKIGQSDTIYAVNARFQSYTNGGPATQNYSCVVALSIGDSTTIDGPRRDVMMCPINDIAEIATSGPMSSALAGTFALPVTFSAYTPSTTIDTAINWC